MIKYCYRCQQEKPLESFTKNKSKKDGFATECKSCKRLLDKSYFEKNKEQIRKNVNKYRLNNLEKASQSSKNSRLKNKEKYKKLNENWAKANPEKIKFYKKAYKKANKVKVYNSGAEYRATKLNATPKWIDRQKIACLYSVATMLNKYGVEKWEVDHIYPLRSKFVCGLHTYENLQVITAKANREKSNKIWAV